MHDRVDQEQLLLRAKPAFDHEMRIVVTHVSPRVDDGMRPVKSCLGDRLTIEADIFADGHDLLAVDVVFERAASGKQYDLAMTLLGNDRWRASFSPDTQGSWTYTIHAWWDEFGNWAKAAKLRRDAGQDMAVEIDVAAAMLTSAAGHDGEGAAIFKEALDQLGQAFSSDERLDFLLTPRLANAYRNHGPRRYLTTLDRPVALLVERRRASLSAWYEVMPRSQSGDVNRHGTFDDVIQRLPYVKELGFDVLYFPPIHPIGLTNRKGRNNSLTANPGEPGSPYAIGSADGGHDALHPELGTFEDFERLITAARSFDIEIASDFAIQCSPDHPWIKQHPEWFEWLPDGSIRFAENPPKKYEDIVNIKFYGDAYPGVWQALRDVVLFWVGKGVKIFRVDNPHTKPFAFWEWLISEVQAREPDAIFLAEAFTRPNIMQHLAKIGFTQSYSYFTWRDTKAELTNYLTELTKSSSVAYMRPNFFVNTPDINPLYLQQSGRAGFRVRAVLAATLSTSWGVYNGFELCEAAALPGKEEYLDSEKYQLRAWDWDRPGHIREDIARLNALRRDHAALQQFPNLAFYNVWNDEVLLYAKFTDDRRSFVLIAVNLDPHLPQGGHFEVPLWEFGLPDDASVEVEDLLSGQRFTWTGKVQHVLLNNESSPYAIWRIYHPEDTPRA